MHTVLSVTDVLVELALVLCKAVVKFSVPDPERLLGVPLVALTVNALFAVLVKFEVAAVYAELV